MIIEYILKLNKMRLINIYKIIIKKNVLKNVLKCIILIVKFVKIILKY